MEFDGMQESTRQRTRDEQITHSNRVAFLKRAESITSEDLKNGGTFCSLVKEAVYACKLSRYVVADAIDCDASAVSWWASGAYLPPIDARATIFQILVDGVHNLLEEED